MIWYQHIYIYILYIRKILPNGRQPVHLHCHPNAYHCVKKHLCNLIYISPIQWQQKIMSPSTIFEKQDHTATMRSSWFPLQPPVIPVTREHSSHQLGSHHRQIVYARVLHGQWDVDLWVSSPPRFGPAPGPVGQVNCLTWNKNLGKTIDLSTLERPLEMKKDVNMGNFWYKGQKASCNELLVSRRASRNL